MPGTFYAPGHFLCDIMKLIFRKIAPYLLDAPSGDRWEYICGVLDQAIDPPSLAPMSVRVPAQRAYLSPRKRALECVASEEGTAYIVKQELNEVPFDLRRFHTKQEWEDSGSAIVRDAFVRGFVSDRLAVPRRRLFEEVRSLLGAMDRASARGYFISHSFRMKLFEAYFKTGGKVEREPELIREFVSLDRRTYDFGEEFEVDFFGL